MAPLYAHSLDASSPSFALLASRHEGKKSDKKKKYEPFFLVTLAKSGSHLILKVLTEMTGRPRVWVSSGNPLSGKLYSQKEYPWTHFCLSPLLERLIADRKVIVMVRDLRDLSISATHALHADIAQWGKSPKICRKDFTQLSFPDQLMSVIKEESQMEAEDKALIWNFSHSFPQAVALAQDPRVLVCRYEHLVGPHGGGSLQAQKEEIRKIAAYLEVSLSEQEVERISSTIYGDSKTYRKGQIEEWKRTFEPNHKELFKTKFGQYLISLGYEENDEW